MKNLVIEQEQQQEQQVVVGVRPTWRRRSSSPPKVELRAKALEAARFKWRTIGAELRQISETFGAGKLELQPRPEPSQWGRLVLLIGLSLALARLGR